MSKYAREFIYSLELLNSFLFGNISFIICTVHAYTA